MAEFPAPQLDERLTKFGLLMEAALTHQRSAEEALHRLHTHTQSIDAVVRAEIRRTLVEEFQSLGAECKQATLAIQRIKRSADLRILGWSIGITVLCLGIALFIARWILPSNAEIARLHLQRDRLSTVVAELERRGGRIDLRRCANGERLCVRVDPKAPAFGEHQEYRVVVGNGSNANER